MLNTWLMRLSKNLAVLGAVGSMPAGRNAASWSGFVLIISWKWSRACWQLSVSCPAKSPTKNFCASVRSNVEFPWISIFDNAAKAPCKSKVYESWMNGMLPTMIPTPIGMSSIGSKSYLTARKMNTKATKIMMRLPRVQLRKPVNCQKEYIPSLMASPAEMVCISAS